MGRPVEESDLERSQAHITAIHVSAADAYIRTLIEFVREVATASCYPQNERERELARKLICMEPNCYNRPGNWTPDGRGFCGRHAGVMD